MTYATLRLSYADTPLYVRVDRRIGPEYVAVTVTCSGKPGWRKGTQHLVPLRKLSWRRRGAHRRPRWWAR